ncbi:hypothetical protein E2C01_082874 [Portunus trituberculatus]|uniref:Uncharacterized protein n=1 Tax=Portunus trituberculatus TaxID=210409 RepID=A0A5B7J1Z5_PORTR|nr:hypothetical protein [Portunus trituberculatus]
MEQAPDCHLHFRCQDHTSHPSASALPEVPVCLAPPAEEPKNFSGVVCKRIFPAAGRNKQHLARSLSPPQLPPPPDS